MKTQAQIQRRISQRYLALLNEGRQRRLKAIKTHLIDHPNTPLSQENFIFILVDYIPILRLLRLRKTVHPQETLGDDVENYQVLFSPAKVPFGVNDIDRDFLEICLYYKRDYFQRSEIFVCDVVPAYVHIGLGTICTKDFRVIVDSGMQYRVTIARWRLGYFDRLKLLWSQHLPITAVYIFSLSAENFWHFLYDSLPRIYSAMLARPNQKLTVLVPDSLSDSFKELLSCVLPENFDTISVPQGSWVKVDRLIMPSYVSRCENGFLPSEYYEYIRNCVFKKFALAPVEHPTERIYISRSQAKHRRVINEDEVIQYLKNYGFKVVVLEKMSFREQVKLFTQAEVIIAPHGAGLATTLFSGKIKILVLYPESSPTPFFFTQFKGLDQEHYFITHDQFDENADFKVDLSKFKQVLHEQIKLKPEQYNSHI
ncbi:glycosyltransferase family 61 protein [Aphanothece sacrum]|uniref:Capsular polysaccharide biosynthesis protein-like protein n=1 Tax=Aphanothece sacrum FPU1 TaxID=1920663 RepID=A0A401IIR7_APHSA|nr:glycosyltransferase family 61 protein [Aphanothece sacrum]GBF81188.1 capsular polysaccharide biosynthesis protein-like protein [Aphanothece sacrum FPU1]GBF83463.1 capsular polysaccharide biosynthesis protein [Aphanothece sacrum FPU3]